MRTLKKYSSYLLQFGSFKITDYVDNGTGVCTDEYDVYWAGMYGVIG